LHDTDFHRADAELAPFTAPRRLLVQWVPHAFGRRSLNVDFCRWILRRSRSGDIVEIMVHEPFLPFRGGLRHTGAAVVHRIMAMLLLWSAARVWVATPEWERRWRPYALARGVPFGWLPVPSTVAVDPAARATAAEIRSRILESGGSLIGSFAAVTPFAVQVLAAAVLPVLDRRPSAVLLLVGRGSEDVRTSLLADAGTLACRIHATGTLPASDLSAYLAAVDLAVQPYTDGICTRHSSATTLMAHGVPIVTNSGPLTEAMWRDSAAVQLVDVNAVDAVALTIERLLDRPDERQTLTDRARRLYDARLDMSHTVTALCECGAR
jgi:glycosyltransferase involved in cell wall biosynthesis